MNMMEKVARAIYEANGCTLNMPKEDIARVAIQAMREPTEFMVLMVKKDPDFMGYGDDSLQWIYQTMVDAALAEP